jgi:hypothetical protein
VDFSPSDFPAKFYVHFSCLPYVPKSRESLASLTTSP